jgi:hypothetical protein
MTKPLVAAESSGDIMSEWRDTASSQLGSSGTQ